VFLHGLRIENFRAIAKAAISFDDGTALIGENDCGISSVLDALELALGQENGPLAIAPYLFHHLAGANEPNGPIRLQLRFRENQPGEWEAETYAPFSVVLCGRSDRIRELWYEIRIHPGQGDQTRQEFRLRSPGCKEKSSDPELIRLIRQLNPVVRMSAGMLTGHGRPAQEDEVKKPVETSLAPEIAVLVERIRKAVDSRLTGQSLDLKAELEDGLSAALSLIEMDTFKLGKRESGLSRTVGEIIGWSPSGNSLPESTRLRSPNSAPERLGMLLLIGALLRARPAGIIPGADPLWIIEEPEAHLHPITLTSVAMFVGLIQRQKIVTTYSGDLLSIIPLSQVRRLVRHNGVLHQRRVRSNTLSRSELRRFHYHLRSRFGVTSFARLWLLVEGESEYWLIPQIARLMGYEFALEGIACVEFAQCGLDPPIKVAKELGIEWHVLADGDTAGENYATTARGYLENDSDGERLTLLREKDIEHCFWEYGYDEVYKKYSRMKGRQLEKLSTGKIIQAAVRKRSKPFLALSVVDAVAAENSAGIPPILQDMIHACVEFARNSPGRLESH
jgi:putative ATP-dependent endonuclease of OLD family